MKIHFEDEYGTTVHIADLDMVPRMGESVTYRNEDYRVKNVTWDIEQSIAFVTITQNLIKSSKDGESDGRLTEANNAIVRLTKRLDDQEKKSRNLSEQLVSVRTYLRTQKGTK